MGEIKILNPWDVQSKHIMSTDGISRTLYAGECRWGGGESYVCYATEGNVVDRQSSKNGKGWCEDVCPTLNTQDRHAICFQQNQREEVRDMGDCAGAITAESGMHNTNYVCFQLCGDRDNPSVSVNDIAYCIPANPMSDRGQAVCYEK